MQLEGSCLITGGCGTLGRAIIRRATAEKWPVTFTVYSRDPIKQQLMKREYPQHRYVIGDIRDYDRLYTTCLSHSVVIHAAAQKHIVDAENNPIDCFETNINGTRNVCAASFHAGVQRVLVLSTDKTCYPINAYGISKKACEYIAREYNQIADGLTTFHLCRYGNVIGSNGSVLPLWQRQMTEGRKPTITHPDMTRFWLTEQQAVDIVLLSLANPPGTITVPLAPALDMEHFARYLLGDGVELETIGLRPGEKMHECLITAEEMSHATYCQGIPSVSGGTLTCVTLSENETSNKHFEKGYHSDDPSHWLTADELRMMAGIDAIQFTNLQSNKELK